MATITEVRSRALRSLIPPPRLRLSTWIEQHIRLPEGTSALPGPVRLWPYQREIADAIGDATVERVTICKGARLGFTVLLTSAIGAYVANEPAAILVLLPTEADCQRGFSQRATITASQAAITRPPRTKVIRSDVIKLGPVPGIQMQRRPTRAQPALSLASTGRLIRAHAVPAPKPSSRHDNRRLETVLAVIALAMAIVAVLVIVAT